MDSVLVIGGTGHFGRHIVESLVSKDIDVRVLSRNVERARTILGDKVEIVAGDITSREDIVSALRGTRALIIAISAFTPALIRRLYEIEQDAVLTLLNEAKKAGIERIVYISSFDTGEGVLEELGISLDIAIIKRRVEQEIAKSDFNWTVLGASPSMELIFTLLRGRFLIVPGGGPPAVPTVSADDVGEIVSQTVMRNDLSGRRIRMVGPDVVSFAEAANIIGQTTGRHIRFVKAPLFPMRTAAVLSRPFNPYLWQLFKQLRLLNLFPKKFADEAREDYKYLQATFNYKPTSIAMDAKKRLADTGRMDTKKPLWKHILAVVAVPVGGFLLLNLLFLAYALVMNGLRLILPISPGLMVLPTAILLIIGFIYVFRSHLSTGIKGTLATIPLVTTYVAIGIFTSNQPVLTYLIGAAVYMAIIIWLLKTKQSFFYIYSVTVWTIIMAIFTISGGDI